MICTFSSPRPSGCVVSLFRFSFSPYNPSHSVLTWLIKTFKNGRKNTRHPPGQDMVTDLVLVFFSPGMAGISCLLWFPSRRGVGCLPCGEAGQHFWLCSPGPRLCSPDWEPGFRTERREQAFLGHLGRRQVCSLYAHQAFAECLSGLWDTRQGNMVNRISGRTPWGWRGGSWCDCGVQAEL